MERGGGDEEKKEGRKKGVSKDRGKEGEKEGRESGVVQELLVHRALLRLAWSPWFSCFFCLAQCPSHQLECQGIDGKDKQAGRAGLG